MESSHPRNATLRRRLASMLYELLALLAIWFLAGFVVVGLLPQPLVGWPRVALQGYLVVVTGLYFVWFWRRGGQTLAMKTWRLRVVDAATGARLTWAQAWLRYAVAVPGALLVGLGFLWALLDPERQFLHDRLASTRVIRQEDDRG